MATSRWASFIYNLPLYANTTHVSLLSARSPLLRADASTLPAPPLSPCLCRRPRRCSRRRHCHWRRCASPRGAAPARGGMVPSAAGQAGATAHRRRTVPSARPCCWSLCSWLKSLPHWTLSGALVAGALVAAAHAAAALVAVAHACTLVAGSLVDAAHAAAALAAAAPASCCCWRPAWVWHASGLARATRRMANYLSVGTVLRSTRCDRPWSHHPNLYGVQCPWGSMWE